MESVIGVGDASHNRPVVTYWRRHVAALAAIVFSAVLIGLPAPSTAQIDALEPPPVEAEGLSRDAVRDAMGDVFDRIWIPRSRFTNSPHLRSVFRPVVAEVRKATVELRSGGRRVGLGGIVGPDGWVVTKASLVVGAVTCRLQDGRELDARLIGVDPKLDLAMLKIDVKAAPTLELSPAIEKTGGPERLTSVNATPSEAPELPPEASAAEAISERVEAIATAEFPEPRAGDWLATVGLGRDPIAIGVMSVAARTTDKRPGFLGVTMATDARGRLEPHPDGVPVREVHRGGAAARAGMRPGDVIASVDGKPTATAKELKEAISLHSPGDRVRVEVVRLDERLRLLAVLQGWAPNLAERRAFYQNSLGGDLSERRFGFDSVLQHDTVLKPRDCGGPVVDLDGRVVGFNIARAGRTESYALPVEVVHDRLYELMSGRLAPTTAD